MTPTSAGRFRGGRGMRGFRFILAIGFTTALLCGRYAPSTDLQPADSATIDRQQDYRSSQKLDTATPEVMQGVLGNAKPDRKKPRRTRPAPRKSGRPKTVTQRTRQVGKEARRRSAQRVQKARSRSKQQLKRRPVAVRPNARNTLRRPPLVQANKSRRSPKPPTADRVPTTSKPKKPKPSKK